MAALLALPAFPPKAGKLGALEWHYYFDDASSFLLSQGGTFTHSKKTTDVGDFVILSSNLSALHLCVWFVWYSFLDLSRILRCLFFKLFSALE